MFDEYKRAHKHSEFFNDYELDALKPVFALLEKNLGDFTKKELNYFLRLIYRVPDDHRRDQGCLFQSLWLAQSVLTAVLQHEINLHSHDPKFGEAISRMIDGNPDADTFGAIRGLRGLLDEISRRGLSK